MRCHIHPQTEATGVCLACGNAVCAECGIPVEGVLHCRTCIEMGRIRKDTYRGVYPEHWIPHPRGRPIKILFTVGMFGSLMVAFSSVAYSLFGYSYFGPSLSLLTVALLAMGISISLVGFGFYGLGRNYGVGVGSAASALAQVTFIGYGLFAVFYLVTRGYDPYGYYLPYALLIAGVWLFEAATLILGGVAFIFSRRFQGNEDLALTTGIVLIIAGALFWIPIVGLFRAVAAVIAAVAFSKATLVGNQE